MSAIEKLNLVAVDDYLAGELISSVKHEYVGGIVYAMAGARNVHNRIATNAIVSLGSRLRKKPCQPYNSDTKVRIEMTTHVRFYYPDVSVVCEPNSANDSFQDKPVVIIEVLSPTTRRTDESEKKEAYLTIPSLQVYVLLESETAAAILYRRTKSGFQREVRTGLDMIIPLPEIDAELPLDEIYDGVEFVPEPHTDVGSR